ncbi:hypothetical protein DFR48_10547 [Ciceribacter lividus]|uniref:Uncharacterized protein n=1 Tax=Ciceribacter lividus TaxID=1197950 RepID=A0A6I7HN24_9HYPH|nr:hypothetical protein [Ciceribacter lividus]RCW24709.1 hypothetical protein DFR48_10547 [Ciceribacter lividus]
MRISDLVDRGVTTQHGECQQVSDFMAMRRRGERVGPDTSTGDFATMSPGFNGVNGGLTVDRALTALQHVGSGSVSYTGAFVATTLALGGDNVIKFGQSSSVRSGMSQVPGSSLAASGDTVSFQCSVPIEGWS